MEADVRPRLLELAVQHLPAKREAIIDSAVLQTDLGADSLEDLTLFLACEKEFGIKIPDEDCPKLQTYGDLVLYVTERVNA